MVKSFKDIVISRYPKFYPQNLIIRLSLTDTRYEIDCEVKEYKLFNSLSELINDVSSIKEIDTIFSLKRYQSDNKDDIILSIESSFLENVSMISVINAEDIRDGSIIHKPIHYLGSRTDLSSLLWRIKNNTYPDTNIMAQ